MKYQRKGAHRDESCKGYAAQNSTWFRRKLIVHAAQLQGQSYSTSCGRAKKDTRLAVINRRIQCVACQRTTYEGQTWLLPSAALPLARFPPLSPAVLLVMERAALKRYLAICGSSHVHQ
eukprot:6197974-Pleurochrysis_carterae.AAC.2